MDNFLIEVIEKNKFKWELGKVADYIPELGKASKDEFGIYIKTLDGKEFFQGNYEKRFTIQSISKILVLMLAILDNGEEYVFSKVGMEPSGDPFNSMTKLETSSRKKPYNPLINAGAVAVTSMIYGSNKKEKFERILSFIKEVTEDETLELNAKVYVSEAETGDRNRAMGYFLKSQGIIVGNVEEALDTYFKQCSIEITAKNLATIGLFLANGGKTSQGKELVTPQIIKIINSIMCTCGMYDESGEVAIKIGMPSKSGVGGGIVSVAPGKMGIGIYGPALNSYGNSVVGLSVLEEISKKLNLNIFGN